MGVQTKDFGWVDSGTEPTFRPANVRVIELCGHIIDFEFSKIAEISLLLSKFGDFFFQNDIFMQNRV